VDQPVLELGLATGLDLVLALVSEYLTVMGLSLDRVLTASEYFLLPMMRFDYCVLPLSSVVCLLST